MLAPTFENAKPTLPTLRLGIGLIVWLVAWPIGRWPLEVAILLFAPLVIVPLARPWLRQGQLGWQAQLHSWIDWLELPAALSLVASFTFFERGWIAGLCACPWAIVTVLLAITGIVRAIRDRSRWFADFGFIAATLMIPVGGYWAIASRMGWQPGGFSDVIVMLSGVHFHYAAFALPILSNVFAGPRSDWFAHASMIGASVGVPLVGLGINTFASLEIVAVIFLVTCCVAVAIQEFRWTANLATPRAKLLAAVSAISLVSGMMLAGVFGMAEFLETTWVNIPTMIASHGVANAFGFTLCGLLAAHTATIPSLTFRVLMEKLLK